AFFFKLIFFFFVSSSIFCFPLEIINFFFFFRPFDFINEVTAWYRFRERTGRDLFYFFLAGKLIRKFSNILLRCLISFSSAVSFCMFFTVFYSLSLCVVFISLFCFLRFNSLLFFFFLIFFLYSIIFYLLIVYI